MIIRCGGVARRRRPQPSAALRRRHQPPPPLCPSHGGGGGRSRRPPSAVVSRPSHPCVRVTAAAPSCSRPPAPHPERLLTEALPTAAAGRPSPRTATPRGAESPAAAPWQAHAQAVGRLLGGLSTGPKGRPAGPRQEATEAPSRRPIGRPTGAQPAPRSWRRGVGASAGIPGLPRLFALVLGARHRRAFPTGGPSRGGPSCWGPVGRRRARACGLFRPQTRPRRAAPPPVGPPTGGNKGPQQAHWWRRGKPADASAPGRPSSIRSFCPVRYK